MVAGAGPFGAGLDWCWAQGAWGLYPSMSHPSEKAVFREYVRMDPSVLRR